MSEVTQMKYSHLSNDLYWTVYHHNGDHFERNTWTGYNDGYWWQNVAHTEDFLNHTCKCGAVLRLNIEDQTVEVLSEAKGAKEAS